MKNFTDIKEISQKGVTFTFGRFNPPTVGHLKLALKMKALSGGDDIRIYTSHTTDRKKNPLTNAQIRKFMNPMLPVGIDVVTSNARTVFDDILIWNQEYIGYTFRSIDKSNYGLINFLLLVLDLHQYTL